MTLRTLAAGLWLAMAGMAALATPARAQRVEVSMQAEPRQVSVDETLTLRIRVELENADAERIELPSLEDFEVLRRQSSHPMQFSFGFGRGRTVRSTTVHTFLLRPLQAGRFEIAPVEVHVDGEVHRSDALTVAVEPGSGGGSATGGSEPPPSPRDSGDAVHGVDFDDKAFLHTYVDKAEPYVGEQVTVTVSLYLHGSLGSMPAVEKEPDAEGFWVQDLLPPSRNLRARRKTWNGRAYHVYLLRRFAAFPLKPGKLRIEPMRVRIDRSSLFDLLRGGARPALEREGEPVTVEARPLPEQGRPELPVAVGDLELSASLDREQARTGDAVTLKATVSGQGNLQGVELPTPRVEGLQILAPEIRDDIEAPNDTVGGTRTYEWLVVPQRPGHFELGPLQLAVFDPESKAYATISSEALELTAAGQAVEAEPAQDDAPVGPSQPDRGDARFGPLRMQASLERARPSWTRSAWYPLALALPPLAWLMFLGTGWIRRRSRHVAHRGQETSAYQQAQQALQRAAEHTGDPRAFHRDLHRALKLAIEARLDEPIGGLTYGELRDHLIRRGASAAVAERLASTLERYESHGFMNASLSDEDARHTLQQAGERLQEVEAIRVQPREDVS